MKKLLSVLLILVLSLSLSACGNKEGSKTNQIDKNSQAESAYNTGNATSSTAEAPTSEATFDTSVALTSDATFDTSVAQISRSRAIEIALAHAGVNSSDAYDIEAELDREYGVTVWEVEFESGGYDYSYDINALTEEVLKNKKERD